MCPTWTKTEIQRTRTAAELGDAAAQRKLATILAAGGVSPPNYLEAIKWYRKASEKGDADAQYNLALMYLRGEGTKKNSITGLRWLRASARNGSDVAEETLAEIYERGAFGLRANKSAALRWYTAAARHGSPRAKFSLGLIYLARESATARSKGLGLVRDAARGGVSEAHRVLEQLADGLKRPHRKRMARQ